MDQAAYDALSPRERECLRLIGQHLQVKEAAARLGISPKTVETHLASARLKLGHSATRPVARALVGFEAQCSSPRSPSPIPASAPDRHPYVTSNAAEPLASVVREPPQRPWPLPPDDEPSAEPERRINDLGALQRLGLIILIPIMIALLVMLAWGVANSMHETVRAVYPGPAHETNDAQTTNGSS